ncbi:hypothetical protein DV736_g5071, partial [Chaetothyriales sp. CBS 134916]
MTGLTAYGSLHEIAQAKKGEVILVSAAAGAVGQMVGQIAVREGLYVIGSVGDDKKLDFITKQLGFHAGFNYKKENIRDAVQRLAPDGIDIFYDNVGGELLDVALENLNVFGRIVACGAISQYNNKGVEEAYGVKNTGMLIRKRIKWQGFLVFDPNIAKWREQRDKNISEWIADGSFKSIDYVTEGVDNASMANVTISSDDQAGLSPWSQFHPPTNPQMAKADEQKAQGDAKSNLSHSDAKAQGQEAKGQFSDLGQGVRDSVQDALGDAVASLTSEREGQAKDANLHDEGKSR